MTVISNNLVHDAVVIYIYQKSIIGYLKGNFDPKFIHYITDGAPQHFKNKYNCVNLSCHELDFNIPADWSFHAIANGKESCDEIGVNLKRLAAKASLQRSWSDQILTALALYE